MKIFRISVFALFFLMGTWACQSNSEKEENTAEETENAEGNTAEEANNEVQTTRGQVITLGEAGENGMLTIQVDHEEIPDFMMAMRMELKVNKDDVTEVKEGDKISFEILKMEDSGFKMQNVEKLAPDTELTLKKVE